MWTEKHIQQLRKNGNIRGYILGPKKKKHHKDINGNRVILTNSNSKEKDWLELNLQLWCNDQAVTMQKEYRFCPERKWRFDYAIESFKIAVEYEGGIFQKNSGHNTAKHYTKDTDKYNKAQALGWRVIRFTAMNYRELTTQLNEQLTILNLKK